MDRIKNIFISLATLPFGYFVVGITSNNVMPTVAMRYFIITSLNLKENRDTIWFCPPDSFTSRCFIDGYDVMICTVRTHKRFSIQGNDFIVRKRNLQCPAILVDIDTEKSACLPDRSSTPEESRRSTFCKRQTDKIWSASRKYLFPR